MATLPLSNWVRDCLDRIEARDDDIKAWAYFDPELALAQARACDTGGERKGPLHGVPFGVKDIIATYDMPTGMGVAGFMKGAGLAMTLPVLHYCGRRVRLSWVVKR